MTTQDHIKHINDITINFAASLTAGQHNAAVTAMNRAKENIEWLSYHGDSISEWLTVDDAGGTASGTFINTSLLLFAIASLRLLLL